MSYLCSRILRKDTDVEKVSPVGIPQQKTNVIIN